MLVKDRRGLRYWTWRSARLQVLGLLVMLGAPNVGEKRRAAVLRAAAELGYRPNELARGPVRGRTHTIAVLLSDLHNPFFAETVAGMEESDSFRYRTLLSTGYRDPNARFGRSGICSKGRRRA